MYLSVPSWICSGKIPGLAIMHGDTVLHIFFTIRSPKTPEIICWPNRRIWQSDLRTHWEYTLHLNINPPSAKYWYISTSLNQYYEYIYSHSSWRKLSFKYQHALSKISITPVRKNGLHVGQQLSLVQCTRACRGKPLTQSRYYCGTWRVIAVCAKSGGPADIAQ